VYCEMYLVFRIAKQVSVKRNTAERFQKASG
jgi:hypothetical protein